MTHSEALTLVGRLAHAFPHQDVPEETAELYAEHLARFSDAAGERAVERLISEHRFFPSVAILEEFCRYEDRSRLEHQDPPRSQQITPADEEMVRQLLGRYWGNAGPDRRLDALRSTGRASAEEIDRAAREKARAMASASTPVQVLEPSREAIPRHPSASECSGKPVRHKNGHLICTHCSRHVCPDDLEKGCAP